MPHVPAASPLRGDARSMGCDARALRRRDAAPREGGVIADAAKFKEGVEDVERFVGELERSHLVHINPMAEWPALNPAALYGLAGHVVETIYPTTEADRVGLLGSVLIQFGSIVGPG